MSDLTIKPKKKLKKTTKILLIVIACVLVVVLAATGVLLYMQNQKTTNYVPADQNRHNFEGLLMRPSFAGQVSSIPADDSELINYAYSLYELAMQNSKNCEEMLAFSNCSTRFSVIGIDNYIDLDIVLLKNQNNFFRIDYRLKNNVPFLNLKAFAKQINDSLELVITERYYADTSMEHMVYQKVRNADVNENNLPTADWTSDDSPIIAKQMPQEVYNSSQEGDFTLVGYTVTPETIKSAVVTHNKKDKYYSVDLVFDCSVPLLTENIVGLIRDGSGDPNANYNEMTMNFTIWDNGYLRSLKSYETWSAAALGVSALKFESVFDYNWMISYNEKDCEMSTYPDFVLMKSQIT